ncbi:MAG TPA: GNAT family N-acetyltransferase [Bellilinea sp.]|nr:GNAT family N-acetyltransferase [Bellilinea sp.]
MITNVPTLRPASESDVVFLLDVILYAQFRPGNHERDFTRVDQEEFAQWTLEHVRGEHPGSTTSVIELHGRPIGRHRVVRTPEYIQLAGIQLLPEHRSHGYGSYLIHALMDEARLCGKWVRIHVEKENDRAYKLYRSLGFEPFGEDDREYWLQWKPSTNNSEVSA